MALMIHSYTFSIYNPSDFRTRQPGGHPTQGAKIEQAECAEGNQRIDNQLSPVGNPRRKPAHIGVVEDVVCWSIGYGGHGILWLATSAQLLRLGRPPSTPAHAQKHK